jgi:hypothetical protein
MPRHHCPRCCRISLSHIIGHTAAVVVVARDGKECPTMPSHLRLHSHYLGSCPHCLHRCHCCHHRRGQGTANNAEAPSFLCLCCHCRVSGQGTADNAGKTPSPTCWHCPCAPSSMLMQLMLSYKQARNRTMPRHCCPRHRHCHCCAPPFPLLTALPSWERARDSQLWCQGTIFCSPPIIVMHQHPCCCH